MSKPNVIILSLALVGAFVLGALLCGQSTPAVAQQPAPAAQPTVTLPTQPVPVVAAVPYQSRTEYEQDPFEPARLRRTTNTVMRVMLVKADGTLEIKEAP